MIRSYRESREKYRPRGIRVLFIAESPPSSGGYFYFERPASHLFRETMKALRFYPEWERMPRDLDKRPYLKRFQAEGYFLIDTCKSPIDKRARKDRARAIVEGAKRIPSEVRELDPEKIVIVKKTVYGPVREALDKAGLAERILNDEPLPFPSHGNQPKYREGLRRLLGVVLTCQDRSHGIGSLILHRSLLEANKESLCSAQVETIQGFTAAKHLYPKFRGTESSKAPRKDAFGH